MEKNKTAGHLESLISRHDGLRENDQIQHRGNNYTQWESKECCSIARQTIHRVLYNVYRDIFRILT